MVNLITEHIDIWTAAQMQKTNSGRGRRKNSNGQSPHGIKKLRELILELAVRGKLVPQEPNDEPASVLLEKIAAEKARLIKESEIKKQKPFPEISKDEKPFALPVGWGWVRLGNVGNIFNGNSVNARAKEEKYTNIEGGLPFIATKDVGYGWEELDYGNGISIPKDEPKFKVAQKSAVLICSEGGSAGKKCGITNQDICFGNKLFANELYGNIEPSYILANYLSPTFFYQFSDKMTGIIGGISAAKFSQLLLPIPPLAEQHRIVAKVDKLMAFCDQLEQKQTDSNDTHQTLVETLLATLANAADQSELAEAWQRIDNHFDTLFTTEQSIDHLKLTILQLAVMGKLVPQDLNGEPASVLLEKITKEKTQFIKEGKIKKQKPLPSIAEDEIPFELPQGWTWIRLRAIVEYERGITYGIVKMGMEPRMGGVKTLRCSDVKYRKIDLTNVRMVSKEISQKYKRTILKGHEILINIRGTLGGCCIAPKEIEGYNIAREIAMVPILKQIESRYVLDVLSSPYIQKTTFSSLRGIAYKGLNLNLLTSFLIPLPSLAEQHRIVAKVDELMALCDALKAQLNDAQTTQVQLADAIVEQAIA